LQIQVKQLSDFTSDTLIVAIIKCFERISQMLTEKDNFVDLKFLRSQNLKEATHKFKVCQALTQYLKTLGYYYDISFNVFLYPSVKETRKLLGFLFEFIFKGEEEQDQLGGGGAKVQPSNEFEVLLKRRLGKWSHKPWMMPAFLKTATRRSAFVGAGDIIQVNPDVDLQRIGQCKSKKAKGVYELMRTFRVGEKVDLY
jgi:Protein of unknown function (DUF812)